MVASISRIKSAVNFFVNQILCVTVVPKWLQKGKLNILHAPRITKLRTHFFYFLKTASSTKFHLKNEKQITLMLYADSRLK
jgi:hypothetical protein